MPDHRYRISAVLGLSLALVAWGAPAHEYWIAADDFTVEPGESVALRLKVGQMMAGNELPWLDQQVESFDLITSDGGRALTGIAGDLPAASFVAEEPGLDVVAHVTYALPITFDTLAEFRDYLEYEGLGPFADAHVARGLPETAIIEAYARNARALIQVGPVREGDSDRAIGLPFELVAEGNPYAGSAVVPVRLTWQGAPEADTQIAIFREGEGGVSRELVLTDADGRAEIPLESAGLYLLNAVHLEPVENQDHVWKSTWASLTFALPPEGE